MFTHTCICMEGVRRGKVKEKEKLLASSAHPLIEKGPQILPYAHKLLPPHFTNTLPHPAPTPVFATWGSGKQGEKKERERLKVVWLKPR